MSSPHEMPTPSRRHSFSASNLRSYRHKNIPSCDTSHPDNPIPSEPVNLDRPLDAMLWADRVAFRTSSSNPRSSADSLASNTEDSSDSNTPPSTPPTEFADDRKDGFISRTSSSPGPIKRKRRASTTYASNTDQIKQLLGDGTGTRFLQKYMFCCGEGCCMLESLPRHKDKHHKGVEAPDNAAFRFLGLNIGGLALDTHFTKTVELPEPRLSFASIRRQSISEKFPEEEQHEHTLDSVKTYPPTYMKPHPPYDIFNAPVYGARELTKPGAQKRTYHFDIDVTEYPEEGGVDFKVGGAIGVCPPNDPAVVEDIMDQLCIPRFQRDKAVRLRTKGGRWPTIWGDEAERELLTTRREVLTWTVDISSTAPTKPLFRVLAEYATAPNEKQILLYLASAQGQAAFCDLRTGPHITLQQLLHAFPSSKPPLEALCSVLSQLMPRFYSLSNDPHVSSAREGLAGRRLIEVAVTVHDTAAQSDTTRSGVGSGFLERLASKFIRAEEKAASTSSETSSPPAPGVAGRNLNLRIPMFRGLMANPLSREFASDGPMLLIGAGVGMAPFRGFILNRLKNANCANKIWLIQGIRDSMLDEIYRGELGDHEGEIKRVVQSRAAVPPPIAEEDPDVVETGAPKVPPLKAASSLGGGGEGEAGEEAAREGADDESAATPDKVLDASSSSNTAAAAQKQQKVAKYVQDEVRMQADIVWFVINAPDGRIFVCGSSKGMGEGVESALVDVAMDKGNLDEETARLFWKGKAEGGQFIMETW